MSVYGYCRISTPQQNIERQVRNIAAAYPAAHIVREAHRHSLPGPQGAGQAATHRTAGGHHRV